MRIPTRATKIAEPFKGYMHMRRFALALDSEQDGMPQATACNVLSGPGHNVALVSVLLMHPDGRLEVVLKGGDTRPARVLRGESYVKLGAVGGRLDKPGHDASSIARAEVKEELGAEVLDGGLVALSEMGLPTMPGESTESDRYFVALSHFPAGAQPDGDGHGMELPGLMTPVRLSLAELEQALTDGKIGEGARVQVCLRRALDRLGYVPELERYVFDLPKPLAEAHDTLGVGAAVDLRKLGRDHPALKAPPQGPEAKVNDVKLLDRVNTHLEESSLLVNARVAHAVRKDGGLVTVGDPFRIQFLHVPYDRVKLVVWANDPARGPLVLLEEVERPIFAVKGMALKDEWQGKERAELGRKDVLEARMHVGVEHRREVIEGLAEHAAEAIMMARGLAGEPERLGPSVDASPGQSDLRYHFFHVEVPVSGADAKFVPLADALRLCRADGHADAAAEAALLRIGAKAGWIPQLGMSIDDAKKALG